jgi:outer membrane biosynthesis protein TonB
MSDKEKKDRRISLLVSLGTHAALVLLFLFVLAWKQPFPPKPEYGIELNIGFDDMGTGMDQPTMVESPSEVPEPEEPVLEALEEVEPAQTPNEEAVQEEVVPEEPEVLQDSRQEDSPVYTEPEPEPEPEPSTPPSAVEQRVESASAVEEAVEEPAPKPTQTPPPQPKVNERALYPGAGQGPDADQRGDAGKEEGTVDARAIYGKSGGGQNGPSLDLAGWMWNFAPNPDDTSNENGIIVFEIKVDERGDVVGVRTLEKTVSSTVELIYRKEVERLTFSPTPGSSRPAPVTTGRITFIIRSK